MKKLILISVVFISGCGLNFKPCINPCPIPTTPPITTPTPIPTPIPTPTPLCVAKKNPSAVCTEGAASRYWNQSNQMLSFVTGCNINSDCPLADWKATLVSYMTSMNNAGFCVTYDLQECNQNCLPGSEAGVRGLSDNFTEYYQPITTAQKVRWADALSICNPVFDSNTVEEVKKAFLPAATTSCPVKVEGDYFVQLQISSIGGDPLRWTATAKYCGFPLRSDIFPNCGTKCCTLGVDGGSQAAIDCEVVLSGIPNWQTTGNLGITVLQNPYNVRVDSGNGTLKACGISSCSNEVQF